MKKEIIQNIACFVAGMSITVILQCVFPTFLQSSGYQEIIQVQTNKVEVVVGENEGTYTNRPVANPNLDWFKDNSDYIWDSWKVK